MSGWQRVVIMFLLGCGAFPLNAQIYTWEDEQGHAHFSDTKPVQRPHKTVTPSATSIMPMGNNIQRRSKIKERSATKSTAGQNRKKAMSKRARSQQKQAKKCARYRTRISRLDQQLRAGYTASTGNRLRHQRREVSQKLSRECLLN